MLAGSLVLSSCVMVAGSLVLSPGLTLSGSLSWVPGVGGWGLMFLGGPFTVAPDQCWSDRQPASMKNHAPRSSTRPLSNE